MWMMALRRPSIYIYIPMNIIYRRFKVEFNINSHAYTSTYNTAICKLVQYTYCILLNIITIGACVKKILSHTHNNLLCWIRDTGRSRLPVKTSITIKAQHVFCGLQRRLRHTAMHNCYIIMILNRYQNIQ